MESQTPNINVVRSVWRRIKKGKIRDLEIRDLKPVKDVKAGGKESHAACAGLISVNVSSGSFY